MILYNVLIHSPMDPITETMDAWCLKSVYDDAHEEIERTTGVSRFFPYREVEAYAIEVLKNFVGKLGVLHGFA